MQTNYCSKIKSFFRRIFGRKKLKQPKTYKEVELIGTGFTMMPSHLKQQYKEKREKEKK